MKAIPQGILIGLLLGVVAFAAFQYGRGRFVTPLQPAPIVEAVLPSDLVDELATPIAAWVDHYGAGDESRLYYNVVMMRVVLNQHAKVINSLRAATQPVEKQ